MYVEVDRLFANEAEAALRLVETLDEILTLVCAEAAKIERRHGVSLANERLGVAKIEGASGQRPPVLTM